MYLLLMRSDWQELIVVSTLWFMEWPFLLPVGNDLDLSLSQEAKQNCQLSLLDQGNRRGILNCLSNKTKPLPLLMEKKAISVVRFRGRHDLTVKDFQAIAKTPIGILDSRWARESPQPV
ncbi:hypothetical protein BCY86_01785 [Pajaroellobacter abortibovis]|uniref:Uncharacterized protein n=1 Tax=Pajaroellobacter abortibovis TaxID=1882918 RepID=A0A1L6MVH8_9BACT|nr:hypothetical protein BCY86_01785 [Pajaroellobacter abortibovis]